MHTKIKVWKASKTHLRSDTYCCMCVCMCHHVSIDTFHTWDYLLLSKARAPTAKCQQASDSEWRDKTITRKDQWPQKYIKGMNNANDLRLRRSAKLLQAAVLRFKQQIVCLAVSCAIMSTASCAIKLYQHTPQAFSQAKTVVVVTVVSHWRLPSLPLQATQGSTGRKVRSQ